MTYHDSSKRNRHCMCAGWTYQDGSKRNRLCMCVPINFSNPAQGLFCTCLLHSRLFYFASSTFFYTLLQACCHHLARRNGERRRQTCHRTRHRRVTSMPPNSPQPHAVPRHRETPAPCVVERLCLATTGRLHLATAAHLPLLCHCARLTRQTHSHCSRFSITVHARLRCRHRTRTRCRLSTLVTAL